MARAPPDHLRIVADVFPVPRRADVGKSPRAKEARLVGPVAQHQLIAERARRPDPDVFAFRHIRPGMRDKLTGGEMSRPLRRPAGRSEEHTSELQSLMRISYAVFCLKTKKNKTIYTRAKN